MGRPPSRALIASARIQASSARPSRARTAGATAAPEFAEPLSKLERLLAALFNTDPVDRTAKRVRQRPRSSQRTMMTASRAIRDGVVDTWSAGVEQLSAEPR